MIVDKRICYYAVEYYDECYDGRNVKVVGFSDAVTMSRFFIEVSKTICYNDFTDESVVEIVWKGERIHYVGWRPGMLFEYRNENNDVVWEGCFPAWDH